MRSLSLRGAGIGLASLVGLYAVVLGALLTPHVQRFALYAHKINTLFIHDLDKPEQFGFAEGQVTPFYIDTPDGERLYAWHVLPIDVYTRNEHALIEEKRLRGSVEDFTSTKAFHLLASDDAKVVVSFHGNAGHVAQGWRPDTYRCVTTKPNTHIVTIDYRGFGKSTGYPTESGLITDGVALVNWVMKTAHISNNRIVLLGQSLGTAVSSAVALHFASPSTPLALQPTEPTGSDVHHTQQQQPTAFAGVILVAPFSSLPSLLLTYRIGGIFPILLPLRPFPALVARLTSMMDDKWPTGERLAAYYATLAHNSALKHPSGRAMGSVQIFHSLNDFDISYHQTEMICRQMLGDDANCIDGSDGAAVLDVQEQSKPRTRFEILAHGGHNRIITYSSIAAAMFRAFEDL